jgi:tetratricopeptide (TPR) repeat protein
LEWYDRSARQLQSVLDREKQNSLARNDLWKAFAGWARARTRLQQFPDALRDWDSALELLSGQGRDEVRAGRARTLASMGRHDQALADLDEVLSGKATSEQALYDGACAYALSAAARPSETQKAEHNAMQAVELLRRAVENGYRNLPHVERDNDLDSLRDRADFKELLSELHRKRQTKAD